MEGPSGGSHCLNGRMYLQGCGGCRIQWVEGCSPMCKGQGLEARLYFQGRTSQESEIRVGASKRLVHQEIFTPNRFYTTIISHD